ncbi:MAG: universal stress protein [Burkholderiales bacterium]|nr:universal stress protein [Burkholderiales bacterium]
MYKRILLAYDGSETGQKALLDCQDIAQWSQSELFLIAVMPLPTTYIGEGTVFDSTQEVRQRNEYQDILDEGLRRLAQGGYQASGEVVVGESVREITQRAREIDADLIVVGHKHLEGWAARWWRGAPGPALIEHAHCSVLVAITH